MVWPQESAQVPSPATAEGALKGADRLMYDVKRAGKRGYKVGVVE